MRAQRKVHVAVPLGNPVDSAQRQGIVGVCADEEVLVGIEKAAVVALDHGADDGMLTAAGNKNRNTFLRLGSQRFAGRAAHGPLHAKVSEESRDIDNQIIDAAEEHPCGKGQQ